MPDEKQEPRRDRTERPSQPARDKGATRKKASASPEQPANEVDEAAEESFPASDPPSFNPGRT